MPLPAEVIARLARIEFDAREVVEGYLAGRHRSPRHGFAVEFAQHREYAPGDDLRHIDWKVYGRTERYNIKQYEQETNLVAWLVVDASESMRYASGARSKFDLAATAAVALATLFVKQTDAVGLATIGDGVKHFLRPAASTSQVKDILRALGDGPTTAGASTGKVLDELAGRLGRRGIVFLFGDLLDDVPDVLAGIRHLKFQKHEVVVVQTLDAAELDFPFRHPTLFRGLEVLAEIGTDPLAVRESYLKNLGDHLTALDDGCRRLETDLVRLRTDADLGAELAAYLRKRSGG